ncbi:MAG TPA: kelch repeat-containing protein [Phycisphaerae bacterium]|nr:kelch repeat-containing protein [Phycisphaerae bacterium]
MVFDQARDRVLLFGGYNPQNSPSYFADTWEWDGTNWTLRATTGPSPRIAAAMAFDARRRRVILFGGGNNTTYYGDTWEWDGAVWTQTQASGPDPRYGHGMIYEAAKQRVMLFGGWGRHDGGTGLFGDAWAYSVTLQRGTIDSPDPQ